MVSYQCPHWLLRAYALGVGRRRSQSPIRSVFLLFSLRLVLLLAPVSAPAPAAAIILLSSFPRFKPDPESASTETVASNLIIGLLPLILDILGASGESRRQPKSNKELQHFEEAKVVVHK